MKQLPILAELPAMLAKDDLDGSQGTNRSQEPCQIPALTDYQAVQCWLNEYKAKATTYRNYQKEAERLLLWCVYQRRKALSSLNREDFEAYFKFLLNPEPKAFWCGGINGKARKRGHREWRPFQGPLSKSAYITAISVIHSLLEYLTEACYLNRNPLALMRKRYNREQAIAESNIKALERMLELDEWQALLETLHNMDTSTQHARDEKERLHFIVAMLYLLGLRLDELRSHTWNAFRKIQGDWWFFVRGKGDKLGKVPVNEALLAAIIRYRTHLALPVYPAPDEDLPIIASWNKPQALSASQINNLLKKLGRTAAAKFTDNPDKVAKLEKFSAHWLRHFSASMQDQAGISFKHIKANHRHSNDETTRRYVHSLEKERHQAMQKLTWVISLED